jgi:uncharacterized protein YhbP (UPF0306 family)
MPKSTDHNIITLAKALIAGQNTMTLATTSDEGPWAAAVYYANSDFLFYFFSDPASRHIQDSQGQRAISAAIHAPALAWKDIRGIQMSGFIEPISPGIEALKVLRLYFKKFPFVSEFFKQNEKPNIGAFLNRFKVRLFRLRPTLLYYLDNSIQFGFREKISL